MALLMTQKTNISRKRPFLREHPLWYKDAVIYELHVRAFSDSDGDGIGDFRGLTGKLDYLRDLGVTAIWLLPFYPSPLRDDGYDIADYTAVHPNYGTLRDFQTFLKEAHAKGLRIITELVLNHTSDQHPWFQRARREKPGSRFRDFYVWSDTPERYKETRIIFKDFETSNWSWDPVAKAYFWHRFYSHQPDLNYENPLVQKAVFQALDFWLGMGVDGLRLDAVPYLFEREGTTCENLPESHAFLKKLRQHVNQNFKDKMLLAEANQWPEDASAYFGGGEECHMAFHFPLMPRLFMASRLEDRYPIVEILQQTPGIPESCQWAIFLRNHDELTLEMVTDEERDYMYRVYAQVSEMRINLGIRRRLVPLLGNNRRRVELLNGLLFSMPGTPVLYYGDEIGMGDNIYLGDRNGVRTPMQWSADQNAGFSKANPQKLYFPIIIDPEYHYEAVNVEAQQNNPSSLLWWMKRIIALRRRHKAFGYGTIEFLQPENKKVLVFIRRHQEETILVVANLSRFTQCVEVDLSAFKESVPVELFGQTPFPPIGDLPYFLTLGPHTFYWFSLEKKKETKAEEKGVPTLDVDGGWDTLFEYETRVVLEELFPAYLKRCRWFGGKGRPIQSVKMAETIPVSESASITLLQVNYREGEPETYMLPLAYGTGEMTKTLPPQAVVAMIQGEQEEGVLFDAIFDRDFCAAMLKAMGRRRSFTGTSGTLSAQSNSVFRKLGLGSRIPELKVVGAEQSNTSVFYENLSILKFFRRLEEGINPDLEIGSFLTEKRFSHTPPVAGFITYQKGRRSIPATLAFLQGYIPNEGDAWQHTLDALKQYFENVLAQQKTGEKETEAVAALQAPLLSLIDEAIPSAAAGRIGTYLEDAKLLGTRTAELHLALASDKTNPDFSPESFSALSKRSLRQSMRRLTAQNFQLLRKRLSTLPEDVQKDANSVLQLEKEILKSSQALLQSKLTVQRIRCHGDYHLGQVLFTGKDFVIIDFEGEPARPLSERRYKDSPLRDLAGMIRSFHYAALMALVGQKEKAQGANLFRPEDAAVLDRWGWFWFTWVSIAFLKSYLETAKGAAFLPKTREEFKILLQTYLLDKAVYELGYELNNRPTWVKIPLQGILSVMETKNI